MFKRMYSTIAHLGDKRDARRYYAEQGGTVAMAIYRRCRATEIKVNTSRIERH